MLQNSETPFLESDFFKQHYDFGERLYFHYFIKEYPHQAGAIMEKFDKYVNISAEDRVGEAINDLHDVTRASWDNIQVPGLRQSVAEHCDGMHRWAKKFSFGNDERLQRMITMHDIGEAIVGDIPNFPEDIPGEISRKDKVAIETMAAKLLFECPENADDKVLFDEYEERRTLMAHRVKALDILEFASECLKIEREKMHGKPTEFNEFWHTSHARLQKAFDGQVPEEIKFHMQELQAERGNLYELYNIPR